MVLQDPTVNQVLEESKDFLARLETLDNLDLWVQLDLRELRVLRGKLELLVPLELQEHLVTVVNRDSRGMQVPLDQRDSLDHKDRLELLVTEEIRVSQDLQGPQDNQDSKVWIIRFAWNHKLLRIKNALKNPVIQQSTHLNCDIQYMYSIHNYMPFVIHRFTRSGGSRRTERSYRSTRRTRTSRSTRAARASRTNRAAGAWRACWTTRRSG